MSNIKKIIIALGITIVVYGLFSYIYNTYIKEPYKSIYVLTKDIAKNDVIKEEDLKEIKTLNILNEKEYISKTDVVNSKGNMVSNNSLRVGQILTTNVITEKGKQLEPLESYEYISLNIKNASNGVSYEVKKGSTVNIYYTTKAKAIQTILDAKEKIYSSGNSDSNVTCKLLEEIEIFGIYGDKGDNSLGSSKSSPSEMKSFDTIVIRVSAKDALLISNLKEQGDFSLTIVS